MTFANVGYNKSFFLFLLNNRCKRDD